VRGQAGGGFFRRRASEDVETQVVSHDPREQGAVTGATIRRVA
jgi:hypothetical protein